MVEENSENMRREDNNSKEDKVNMKRKDLMRRCLIIFNEGDLFLY